MTKVKLRQIALLESLMILIESIAEEQTADHLVTSMQTQEVVFRVTDGAEEMIRRLLCEGENRILMQGDISNAHDRLADLRVVRRRAPQLAPLCASREEGRKL